ncbi:Blue-light-activated histidine kinase [Poriferisphaera corsica]|uniref:histidine kinase n=1 Tax=Poriferisphaera corsica TaxID=2528020 RepID=A0A517YXQ3_9BACT|nr:PAS domain S-box protein [Poriferisphaera corsica]QDU35010.1 Blue-light-activated histidine kinase [Poriferisphaera corsica]
MPSDAGQEITSIEHDDVSKLTSDVLANKNKYFEMLIENIDDLFWVFDVINQRSVYVSPAYQKITGYDSSTILDDFNKFRNMVHPHDIDIFQQLYADVRNAEPTDINYRIINARGDIVWFRCRSTPIFNDDGTHTFTVGVCRDITERMGSEQSLRESKEHYQRLANSNRQLVMEVNHRVRNNLAGLLSLLKLTSQRSKTVDGFANAMQRRIQVMSMVHDALAQTGWGDIDFRDLLRGLAVPRDYMISRKLNVVIDGPAVMLKPRQVMPLILALLEVYNIEGQAIPIHRVKGTLKLIWEVLREPDRHTLRLTWRQNFSHIKDGERGRHDYAKLAEELVRGFVEYELGGKCELFVNGNINHHILEFPLEIETVDPGTFAGSFI